MKKFIAKLIYLPLIIAALLATNIHFSDLMACGPYGSYFTKDVKPAPKGEAKIQVAILLDVSGSMSGLIEQAKSQLWSVVNELGHARYGGQQPSLEIALYSYGNVRNDGGIPYLTKHSDLTTDLDRISEDLFALSSGGGDEFCGQVIHVAGKELEWSEDEDALKLIFIAGNEPFTQGPVSYKDACKAVSKSGIVVNTIFCGNFQAGQNSGWEAGARLTGGKYMNIDHNHVVVQINSPYDDKILRLNNQLNSTYIQYGSKGKEAKMRQVQQDANASSYGAANVASRAGSKVSGYYDNSHWDLVDARKKKDFKVSEVDRSTLPDSLQKASDKELEAEIVKMEQEREKLSAEIRKLSKQRDKFVADERANAEDDGSLDRALIDALHEQAEKRSFVFEKF